MDGRFLRRTGRWLCLWGLLFLLAGCGGAAPFLQGGEGLGGQRVCSFALLPLQNKSTYPQGGEVVQRLLARELVRGGYHHIALTGDVRKIYRQLGLRAMMTPSPEQLRIIADRLGVEAIIGGEVLQMQEQVSQEKIQTKLVVQLRVYRGRDGRQAFATYHSRQGEDYRTLLHFGRINTISGLTEKVIGEILLLWKEKHLFNCVP